MPRSSGRSVKVRTLRFRVAISADAFTEYYRGPGRRVQVTTDDGQTLLFPAGALQSFVTRDGVHGDFMIQFDDANRLIGIKKI